MITTTTIPAREIKRGMVVRTFDAFSGEARDDVVMNVVVRESSSGVSISMESRTNSKGERIVGRHFDVRADKMVTVVTE